MVSAEDCKNVACTTGETGDLGQLVGWAVLTYSRRAVPVTWDKDRDTSGRL